MTCEICRYGDPVIGEDDEPRLDCRRYPPTVASLDGGLAMFWPQVRGDDWCGEFRHRAAVT